MAEAIFPGPRARYRILTMSSSNVPFNRDAWVRTSNEQFNRAAWIETLRAKTETPRPNEENKPSRSWADWLRENFLQDDGTLTKVAESRSGLSLVLLVSLFVVVLVVTLGCMVPDSSSKDLALSNRLDCLRIISPASSVKSLPLPLPVNRSAHELVFDRLHYPEGTLSSLIDQHTAVCSIMTFTGEELVKFLASAATVYACPGNNYTAFSFSEETNTAHRQLSSAATRIQALAHRYYSMREDYHKLQSSAAEAYKAAELSDYQEVLVKFQPWLLWKVGIDAYSAYVLPLKEKQRQMEETRLGVVALEREIQRLEQILLVVQGLQRSLHQLAASSLEWDAESEAYSNTLYVFIKRIYQDVRARVSQCYSKHDVTKSRGRDCVWRQKRLQEWLREHIIRNRPLKDHWNELLKSVGKGEESSRSISRLNGVSDKILAAMRSVLDQRSITCHLSHIHP